MKFVLSHGGFPGVRRRQQDLCAESFVFCGFPCTLAFSTTDIYRNGLKSHYCVLETAEIRSRSARLWDVLEDDNEVRCVCVSGLEVALELPFVTLN